MTSLLWESVGKCLGVEHFCLQLYVYLALACTKVMLNRSIRLIFCPDFTQAIIILLTMHHSVFVKPLRGFYEPHSFVSPFAWNAHDFRRPTDTQTLGLKLSKPIHGLALQPEASNLRLAADHVS